MNLDHHPLETVITRLLSTEPQDRYASAADVIDAICAATNIPAPPETEAIRDSFLQTAPFVGREQEIAYLEDTLVQAIDGTGSLVLVGGESGVGKSRLVDELRIRALVRGARVIRGQGVDGGGLPYQLWRDVLPPLLLSTKLNDVAASTLKALVPQIDSIIGREVPDAPLLDSTLGQQRLILTIVEVLQQQDRPVVIVLDDLQWTIESLEPVKHLIPHLQNLPLLIIGIYRNDEKPDLPEILSATEIITLPRLDETSIAELSVSMLGAAGEKPEVLDYLMQETEGNAFFMVEIVRTLAEEAGRLTDIDRITLPERIFTGGVREVLRRRLMRIKDQNLLKWAAIIGRQIDLKLLQHLLQNTAAFHPEALESFLASATNSHVLEVSENQWRFAHDKIRELVLTELTENEHAIFYRQVAEAVEAVYAENDSWATVLFELWQQAQDKDKEMTYLPRVMFYYVRLIGDYEAARHLGEYGLQYLKSDDKRRPALLNSLSMIMWRTADYARAADLAEEALSLAEAIGEHYEIAWALHHLATVAYYVGMHHDAIAYYQRSADLHQKNDNVQSQAFDLIMLGWTQCMISQYQEAVENINNGIDLCMSLNDLEGIALGRCTLGFALSGQGRFAEAIAYHHQSLEFYRAIKSPWHISLNLISLGFVYLDHQRDACIPFFCEALTITRHSGHEGLMLEVIAGFAHLYSTYNNTQRAAELVGMVAAHPAMNSAAQMRLDSLLDTLLPTMGEDSFNAMAGIGEALDTSAVVQELLDEFGGVTA